jgi:hypothetical protein
MLSRHFLQVLLSPNVDQAGLLNVKIREGKKNSRPEGGGNSQLSLALRQTEYHGRG